MKIVFVEGYPGFRGAQRSLAALATGLAEDADVEILCTVAGRSVSGYTRTGLVVDVEEVPPTLRAFGGELARRGPIAGIAALLGGVVPYFWRLRRRWRRDPPDIVHCNQARALLLAAPAARWLGIPVVWHLRGLLGFGGLPRRLCFRLADRVVCVSRAVADSLPERVQRRAVVIHNGLVGDRPDGEAVAEIHALLSEVKRERGLDESALVLVTASSFVPYKGLHVVAEALTRLVAERSESRRSILWMVAGDDEGEVQRQRYREDLTARLGAAGLAANVYWAGWRDDVPALMAASDVTVLPTIDRGLYVDGDGVTHRVECSEGFSRVVLESMAAGTAVVASDVAGVREQIDDGSSGLIVRPGDAEALASALERLVDEPDLRKTLVSAARRRVEEFSIDRMVGETRAVYGDILGVES